MGDSICKARRIVFVVLHGTAMQIILLFRTILCGALMLRPHQKRYDLRATAYGVIDTLVIDRVYAGTEPFAPFPLIRAHVAKRGHMGTYYYRICPWGHIRGTYSVCVHMLCETRARMTACIDTRPLSLCIKFCLSCQLTFICACKFCRASPRRDISIPLEIYNRNQHKTKM